MVGTPGCFLCDKHANSDPADAIVNDGVVYAGHLQSPTDGDVYLGWLVVEPTRHVAELGDLSDAEAAIIGLVVRDLSGALREITQADHVYAFVLGDGEAEHLHVHVVPRYPGTPRELWGLQIARWADGPRGDARETRELCERLRDAIPRHRDRLPDFVRADLRGLDLVGELLAERRAEAAAEDDE